MDGRLSRRVFKLILQRVDRLRRGAGATGRHGLRQTVASATDGEALVVEQFPDPANQQHLVVLVVAAVATPLHGPQLRELLLPIAQHISLHAAEVADLSDREVPFGRNGRKGGKRGVHQGPT